MKKTHFPILIMVLFFIGSGLGQDVIESGVLLPNGFKAKPNDEITALSKKPILRTEDIPSACSGTLINFDEQMAPCRFADQVALSTQYQAQGVLFTGGWEVLDDCGNFGVSGYSLPNFLAWNTLTLTGLGEVIDFAPPFRVFLLVLVRRWKGVVRFMRIFTDPTM